MRSGPRVTCAFVVVGLALAGAVWPPAPASAQSVVRGPYLQQGGHDSVTIRWRTSLASESTVVYGTEPGVLDGSQSSAVPVTEHSVTLGSLAPDTRYYYAIEVLGSRIAGGDLATWFETAPAPGSVAATRLWVIGDSGTADANAARVYDAYRGSAEGLHTDLWLMLGDNAYNDGTDSQYQAAVFDLYPELLVQTPLWPTLGNHDGASADSASQTGPYYDIFELPTAGELGGEPSGTEAYYSFDHANIHFVVLESYETDRSTTGDMYGWLEADLQDTVASGASDWLIAFWHHPPYTKGSHDSDSETALIEMRTNFLPLLETYGVDLVLAGHSHSYERSFLLDGHYGSSGSFGPAVTVDGGSGQPGGSGAYEKASAGQGANEGAVYAVAGSSGKTSGGSLNHPAMFVSLNTLGSMVLDVNGAELSAVFLDDDAVVQDSFTLQKGPAPATSSISGRVWHDVDANGLRGAEPDLVGIPVDLLLGNGVPKATTTTGAGGAYAFSGLNAGSYRVVVRPGARVFTTPGAGGDPGLDSDFEVASGSHTLLLAEGETRGDLDAGLLDATPLGLADIDLSEPGVEPYAGLDTAFGSAESRESGSAYYTLGTRWVQTLESFDIEPSTELSFEFRSQLAGAPSAIGFDDDGDPSTAIRLFDLDGSGAPVARAIPQSYEGGGDWQTYRIPVGKFFTGTGLRLVIGVTTPPQSTEYAYVPGELVRIDGVPTATSYADMEDAELREASPGANFDTGTGDPANPEFTIDLDDPGGSGFEAQVVLRFGSIFGAAPWQIPPDSEIDSASLFFDIDDTGNDLHLYELTTGFGSETSVTWSSVGGGIDPASQTTNLPTTVPGNGDKVFIDVTQSVQDWSDGTANHGWALLSTGPGGVDLDASENTVPEDRPALFVTTAEQSLGSAAETEVRHVQLPEPRGAWAFASAIALLTLLSRSRARRSVQAALLCGAAVLAVGPGEAHAHGAPDESIAALSSELATSGEGAALLIERGRIRLAEADFEAALADFDAALARAPEAAAADYHAAQALIGLSRFEQALVRLDAFGRAVEGNAAATARCHRLRAHALAGDGRNAEAARSWERYFGATRSPVPDDFLDWSRSLEPDAEAALAALRRGVEALGPLAGLERRAYALEMASGRHTEAAARAEAWTRRRPGNVFLLRYAAEAYAKGGRVEDARATWRQILAGTTALAPHRRPSAVVALESEARRALGE